MVILIYLIAISVFILLFRYAISEGHRIEKQKKFMRDMNKYGKNKNK